MAEAKGKMLPKIKIKTQSAFNTSLKKFKKQPKTKIIILLIVS